MISNSEIAAVLKQISEYLAMDDVAFKPQAYEKAALTIEGLERPLAELYRQDGLAALEKIPGVGRSIAEKIEELVKTGRSRYYQSLKKKTPVDLETLTRVEGLGPKNIKKLYQRLKIKNLADLEKMAKQGKIRNLPHFGLKTEQNILESIAFLKRSKGRFLLGEILPKVSYIIAKLKNLKEVKQIAEAGSVRRRKETIGDADILITASEAKKVIDYFVAMPGIVKIWSRGQTKASIRLKEGFDVDLRVLPENQFGSALQYFTGSKEHNIALRKIALDRGLKLNEYGLFRGSKRLAGKTEKEIYAALKMTCPEPELRENNGEIEAARRDELPKIIGYKDICGDLHIQSDWNGGENSIEELTREAIKMGYQYLGISDHTKFLRIEHGLDEKQLLRQKKAIAEINTKQFIKSRFQILQGCEANIMPDGSIDIDDKVLAQLNYVIAGVHSQMKMPKEKMTQRIIKAMKNPNVDIISHPTGRLIKRRDEYEVDFDEILKAAKATGTILEINAFPERLDLKDVYIKKAKEVGVKMVINTDAHHQDHLRFMEFGVAQARRGWAKKSDIINAWPLEKMLKFLKRNL